MPAAIPFLVAAAVPAAYSVVAYIAASVLVAAYQADRAGAKARQAARDLAMSRTITVRSGVAPRRLLLGTARTGGVLAHAEYIGNKKQFFDVVLACVDEELASIKGFFFNEVFVPIDQVVDGVVSTGQYSPGGGTDKEATLIVTRHLGGGNSFTLDPPLIPGGAISVYYDTGGGDGGGTRWYTVASVSGATVTLTEDVPGYVTVEYAYNIREHPTANGKHPPIRIQWRLGTSTQTSMQWDTIPSPVSSPKWTADHRLLGIASVRALMYIEHPSFVTGEPSVNLLGYGPAGVYDPRTDTYLAGSSNPALLAAWYRTRPRNLGGMGIPSEWIDWASVAVAANICDELITVRKVGVTPVEYEQIKRYECNTVLMLDEPRNDNLRVILSSMAGDFPFTAGKYRCYAGAFRPAVLTLTDDDIDGGNPITFGPAGSSFDAAPNIVNASIVDSTAGYVDNAPTPIENADYIALDGHEEALDLELKATTDPRQASYLMGVALERSRPSMSGALHLKGRGANIALLDCVQFDLQGYGSIAAKTFEVRRRTNAWDGRYGIDVVEVRPNTWALDPDTWTPVDPVVPPDTSAMWRVDNVSGLDAESGTATLQLLADGTVLSRARVFWDAHDNAYVREGGRIEVRWRGMADVNYLNAAPVEGTATETYIGPLIDGRYYIVEARAVNAPFAAASEWVHKVLLAIGKTEPPRNVPLIAIEITPADVAVTVPPNLDVDHALTELRVGGLDWGSAVPLVGSEPTRFAGTTYRWRPPAAGTYRIRARYIDTSGNDSLADAVLDVTVTAADALQWSNVVGRPASYKVVSAGFSAYGAAPGPTGLYNAETGALVRGAARSYTLIVFARDTMAIVHAQHYDVLAEGTDAGNPLGFGRGSADLAADLDYFSTTTGDVRAGRYILLVFGHDEPQGNRLNGGLYGAMVRNGASREVFGGEGLYFASRSAYVLLAISGCGEGGAVIEGYRGGVDNDSNAWVEASFQLLNGNIYSYSCSAAATRGAAQAAANAKAAADSAAATAAAAISGINAIASDNVLSRNEKSRAIQDWNVLSNEQASILAQADNYGVTTQRAAYVTAVNNLAAYLSAMSPSWADTSSDTAISGSTYRDYWFVAYTTRQFLLDAISAAAKARLGALATLNQVDTAQIVDEAATRAINVTSESGTASASRPSGPGVFPAFSLRYPVVASWTNTTGATRLVQIELSARLWMQAGLQGRAALWISTSPESDGGSNDSDLSAWMLGVDTNGLDLSRVSAAAVPNGGTIYAYLMIALSPGGGETHTMAWRRLFLRVTGIIK